MSSFSWSTGSLDTGFFYLQLMLNYHIWDRDCQSYPINAPFVWKIIQPLFLWIVVHTPYSWGWAVYQETFHLELNMFCISICLLWNHLLLYIYFCKLLYDNILPVRQFPFWNEVWRELTSCFILLQNNPFLISRQCTHHHWRKSGGLEGYNHLVACGWHKITYH